MKLSDEMKAAICVPFIVAALCTIGFCFIKFMVWSEAYMAHYRRDINRYYENAPK